MTVKVRHPVLRYHGAKFRLAQWILGVFPEHKCYVEPFGGAAGVLLQKARSYAEVYNDLDQSVANFFRILRDPVTRAILIEQLALTEYSRRQFELAWKYSNDPIEDARRLAIRAQMGFGSAGATQGSTGFRVDTKRQYGTAQNLWQRYPAAIESAGQRFSGVLIENRPAIEVMLQHDADTTLHFVDPPYMHKTRVMKSACNVYKHEMTDADHIDLLDTLLGLGGFVVLSGYESDMYEQKLIGWQKCRTQSRASGGRGSVIRTECVWINPHCQAALDGKFDQLRMFK